jgi:signal peptidase I
LPFPVGRERTVGDEQHDHPGAPRHRRLRWLVPPAVLILAVIVVRAFLLVPFSIPSRSMEPTLQVGDRILVSRLGSPDDLRRGDVVVFDASAAFNLHEDTPGPLQRVVDAVGSIIGQGSDTDYVKRVVGLPGDHVRCCSEDGRLQVNGVAVSEPYLFPGDAASTTTFDVTLPADRYWVMGDHRSSSADSRSQLGAPGGGMVPGEDIIGQVWVRYWPPGRIGTLWQVPLSAIPRNGQ